MRAPFTVMSGLQNKHPLMLVMSGCLLHHDILSGCQHVLCRSVEHNGSVDLAGVNLHVWRNRASEHLQNADAGIATVLWNFCFHLS